jgi:hypothetical protein|tara:strand:- start:394 stop:645 length:252 start_codon:yes stop_codon:yes gene_type:complete
MHCFSTLVLNPIVFYPERPNRLAPYFLITGPKTGVKKASVSVLPPVSLLRLAEACAQQRDKVIDPTCCKATFVLCEDRVTVET